MRKGFLFVTVFVLIFASLPLRAVGADFVVSARAAVLMVAETGEILFEKNAREKRSMASTTKIMTALLACEENTPERKITVTDNMNRVEGTSMGLKTGDKVTLEALTIGALLASGNDAANAIAIGLAGNLDKFAIEMNARAMQIGMENTNFVTPSGLDHKEHYTTAYDMALLGATAIENPAFARICTKKSAKVAVDDRAAHYNNHNRLLREYQGCIGMKTGFTKKSGRCLVTAARRRGATLICVTLNASSDWSDHKKLLDFGFAALEKRVGESDEYALPLVGGKKKFVTLKPAQTPTLPKKGKPVVVPLIRPFEYAPVKKGAVAGELQYWIGGELVARVGLVVA
ncbi:MAG: D-alanyl-D-alanine carboxypeptidase [Oscillospiraceae bacterium]|nr:D-alanyl-D-alanine carboxypeptidase [Oscillospiraceae bacterium]